MGIDIDEKKINVGLYSMNIGKITDYMTVELLQKNGGKNLINCVCNAIKNVMIINYLELQQLKGIGIIIENSSNIENVPTVSVKINYLKEYFSVYYKVPVVLADINNNVEFMDFYGKKIYKSNLLYCTIGTEIGLALICNQSVYTLDYNIIDNNDLNNRINDLEERTIQIAHNLFRIACILDIPLIIVGGRKIESNIQLYKKIEFNFNQLKEKQGRNNEIRRSILYGQNAIYGIIYILLKSMKDFAQEKRMQIWF